MALDSQSQKPGPESLENQGLQEPEIEISAKAHDLRFEEVNEVTWKLTDGRGSIAWSGDRSGGYRTTRAVAWLMGIGNGLWVFRYRNKASRPMKLPAAKRYALEMVKGIRPGRVLTDPITDLNRAMAASIDGCPVEAIGAEPPAVTMSINEDGTYRVCLQWAGHSAEYGSEEYPEDAAFQKLHAWGFRGNFAMRWENGQVATYKRIRGRSSRVRSSHPPRAHTALTCQSSTVALMASSTLLRNSKPISGDCRNLHSKSRSTRAAILSCRPFSTAGLNQLPRSN